MLIFWILIFVFSIILLVKGADWLVENSEKIGLALKISPFIVGVTIVAIGTSLPELASSIAATLKGKTEVVAANVIGSNITNILLIVGLSSIAVKTLIIKRDLIDLDAPLLSTSTVLFLFVSWDKKITFGEGMILSLGFLIYFFYTVFQRREETIPPQLVEVLPKEMEIKIVSSRIGKNEQERKETSISLHPKTFLFLILGTIGLAVGANYSIEAIVKISEILKISSSLIAITALATGTSLPELAVSLRSALQKKHEISLGNIFGSNVFNLLVVAGLTALIKPLEIDYLTFSIGLPFLVVATFLFVISGISPRIHIWEGSMYVVIYILFLLKVCGLL